MHRERATAPDAVPGRGWALRTDLGRRAARLDGELVWVSRPTAGRPSCCAAPRTGDRAAARPGGVRTQRRAPPVQGAGVLPGAVRNGPARPRDLSRADPHRPGRRRAHGRRHRAHRWLRALAAQLDAREGGRCARGAGRPAAARRHGHRGGPAQLRPRGLGVALRAVVHAAVLPRCRAALPARAGTSRRLVVHVTRSPLRGRLGGRAAQLHG